MISGRALSRAVLLLATVAFAFGSQRSQGLAAELPLPPAQAASSSEPLRQPAAQPGSPGPGQPGEPEACLTCHADRSLALTLPSGEDLSLFISPDTLSLSVHEQIGISCDSCHPQITGYPHPEVDYATRRDLSRSLYLACRTCHSTHYERTLDSMHAQAAAAGQVQAPVCTDCHGAHDIQPPDVPRALISETCGQCHTEIVDDYRESVHGSALIQADNPDVPVCTDCHGVHDIPDPRTAQFRIESPELCAGCHADAERMQEYGLSSEVYNLYSVSWHGVDVSVYRSSWPGIWHESAVCTDCHGVHDIRSAQDSASRVNPTNLLQTCRQCHPSAGPNWTGAWTGHNPVSRERTPFVFYTQAFYRSFTPAVLIPTGIYLSLQILRGLVDRVRRNLP